MYIYKYILINYNLTIIVPTAHDEEHSLGEYIPCIGGSETLRPATIFIFFFIVWLLPL